MAETACNFLASLENLQILYSHNVVNNRYSQSIRKTRFARSRGWSYLGFSRLRHGCTAGTVAQTGKVGAVARSSGQV